MPMMNLEAELARYKIKREDVATIWCCSRSTAIRKLNDRSFTLKEAIQLRDKINPELSLEYLYSQNATEG